MVPVAMQFEMNRAVNGIFASVKLDYTLTGFAGVFVDYLQPQVSVEAVAWRGTSARVQQTIVAGTWTSKCRPSYNSYSSGYLLLSGLLLFQQSHRRTVTVQLFSENSRAERIKVLFAGALAVA